MQAQEARLFKLIDTTAQYVVPLFQRPYSWGDKQWKTLWNDVVAQADVGDSRPHFFGSIVTAPARSVPQGVSKYLLIDGQQRLTTTQVLLAALRDAADAGGHVKLRDKVNDRYLLTRHEEGDEQLKVLPTQDDRAAFRAIVRGEERPPTRLADAYRFFHAHTSKLREDAMQLDRLVLAVAERLSLVSITCDEHDNPHLIFESLNAKGEKLTAADLIRNFLLMRVHVGRQQLVFEQHWLPIQQALGASLTEFVRHFLMKEGKILVEADVYFELKDRLASADANAAEAFLAELCRHGMFYARLIDPTRESDAYVSAALARLQRLESTVAYPLLLRMLDAWDCGGLAREQVVDALDVLESFLVRRSICNVPTNQLRRMLPPVFDAVGGVSDNFVDRLRVQLGGNRCPDNATFAAALVTQPLYATSKKNARLRVILERLEQSFGHKEPASLTAAQIEHVLPQTLTPEWEQELGADAQQHWARLLHTLGNLTLTGYNADMSNRPFAHKRAALAGSHYELNAYFSTVAAWTPHAIEARSKALAERAIGIWRDLDRPATPQPAGRQLSPTPVAVRFRDKQAPVASWKRAALQLIEWFEAESPGMLAEAERKQILASVLSLDANRFARSRGQIGGVYVQMHGSAKTLRTYVRWIADQAGVNQDEYEFVLPRQSEPLGRLGF